MALEFTGASQLRHLAEHTLAQKPLGGRFLTTSCINPNIKVSDKKFGKNVNGSSRGRIKLLLQRLSA
jgi:hypothetical protein